MKSRKQQAYYYRGTIYRYVIREDVLRKLKREENVMELSVWLNYPINKITALYYCTQWCGVHVSKEDFLKDYKCGMIRFMATKGHYLFSEMSRLMRTAIRKYRIM